MHCAKKKRNFFSYLSVFTRILISYFKLHQARPPVVHFSKIVRFSVVAARSKSWVCGRSLAGIAGSNPVGGHGRLSLVSAVCCQVEVSA